MNHLQTKTVFKEEVLNFIEDCIMESKQPDHMKFAICQAMYSEFDFISHREATRDRRTIISMDNVKRLADNIFREIKEYGERQI